MSMGANWILNYENDTLPANFEALVTQAGGTVMKAWSDMGIGVAIFATRNDAQAMVAHGFTIMPDVTVNWLPTQPVALEEEPEEHIGDDEPYSIYQWHLPVIEADRVWDQGYTGAGIRVAVLDTGICYYHPDLVDNIDFDASATFVPGTTDFLDDEGHGTFTSGIIAAEDNAYGCIGVAPDATIISVKVLDDTGSGAFSWIIDGIYHAANNNADIINLSLGGFIKLSGEPPDYTSEEAWELLWTTAKAIIYAKLKGSLVVCAAGNEAIDLDHNEDWVLLPGEAGGITISATGPIGLENFDNPASYTNYGKWSIFIAAPGGDSQLYPEDGWWYDMVFSTFVDGWGWASGTSAAAPMVSGVAALVLSKRNMSVLGLELRLASTADKFGHIFKTTYYGWGRVNAYRAVNNIWW
jgi:subtilisin family serine protease